MAKNGKREERTLWYVSLTTTGSNHPREKQLGTNTPFKIGLPHPPKREAKVLGSEVITRASLVKMSLSATSGSAQHPRGEEGAGKPRRKRHPSSILLAPLVPPTGRVWHRARGPAEANSAESAPCYKIGGNGVN